jgi:hypothetical protein
MDYDFGIWMGKVDFDWWLMFGMMNEDDLVKNLLDLVELWRFEG